MTEDFKINDHILVRPLANEVELGDSGEVIKLEPRIMKVLIQLVEKQGQVVTREHLIDTIWDNEFVGEDALTQAVSKLRKVIESDPKQAKIIETIPKTGYRFKGSVTYLNAETTVQTDPVKSEKSSSNLWIAIPALLVVALIFVALVFNQNENKPLQLTNRLQFTSDPGRENHPSFSPNNNQVAFSKRNPGETKMNLYIKTLNSNDVKRITHSYSDDFSSTWSPDGQLIAYLRLSNGKAEIYIIPINNTDKDYVGQKLLTLNYTNQTLLSWSADGKDILFRDKITPEGNYRLFTINTETKAVKVLTEHLSTVDNYMLAIYSKHADQVIFTKRKTNTDDIYIIDLNDPNQNETLLSNFDGLIKDLDWFDESRLIIAADKESQSSLWMYSLESNQLNWLGGERISSFAYSNKNESLVYSEIDYNIDLIRARFDGQNYATQSIYNSTKTEWSPSIAADNSAIVFMSTRSGKDQLWSANLSTDDLKQLTFYKKEQISNPRWSPNSETIAFVLQEENSHGLYLLNAKGGKAQLLLKDKFNNKEISWSYDGKKIYYQSDKSGQKDIWSIDLDSKQTEQITSFGAFYAEESFDQNYLYLTRINGISGLWKLNLSDKSDLTLVNKYPYGVDAANWRLSEKGFYFLYPLNENNRISISHFDFATTEIENLFLFDDGSITSAITFDVSVDRQTLFFTQLVKLESDLLLSTLRDD